MGHSVVSWCWFRDGIFSSVGISPSLHFKMQYLSFLEAEQKMFAMLEIKLKFRQTHPVPCTSPGFMF